MPIDPGSGRPALAVGGMQFLPHSHLLVVGGIQFLALVDADAGRVLKRLPGHSGFVYTPGIRADGRRMAAGSDDHDGAGCGHCPTAGLTGIAVRAAADETPDDAQLSPDGRWIVIADGTDALKVLDARSGRRARRVAAPGRDLLRAACSPDEPPARVGDRHGGTEVWSTATWRPITRAVAESEPAPSTPP